MLKNDVDIEPTSEQVGMPGRSFFSRAVITRDSNLTRLFIMMIAIFIAMSLALPDTFPTLRNFNSMSVQFPEVGILAIAVMITMLTGGIDLSVVSIGNLTATLTALTLTQL
ncbi:MAG: ABC transporter permease, partial [Chloroflexi bacterium]|nr:ABC transporter permease [Chloroflexota bacterium]